MTENRPQTLSTLSSRHLPDTSTGTGTGTAPAQDWMNDGRPGCAQRRSHIYTSELMLTYAHEES